MKASLTFKLLARIHEKRGRLVRVNRLVDLLVPLIGKDCSILDVGCGDGSIGFLLGERLPRARVWGADVLRRETALIPVTLLEGTSLPFPDDEFDFTILIDVLHHVDNPTGLLAEAKRISRRGLIIKDHLLQGWLSSRLLSWMDRVGNERFGVSLPGNYLSESQWEKAFAELGLKKCFWKTDLKIYSFPLSWICDRSLHFIARLERTHSAIA
ncbi:MAG: class I SAM-dependent methyltransferase [Deltaproteobacteria bacterium]|nr:class I SAM-dependent methyltransferase [Deltaproteobacteria bacterium]